MASPARREWPENSLRRSACGQVAADAGGQHGFLDQAGDVFVRQPISGGFTVIAADALEQGTKVDLGIMQILLKRMHRAALIAGASADFNLAPAGFCCEMSG